MLADIARCVRFYSRISVPAMPGETSVHGLPDFRRITWALPLASLIIVAPSAVTLAVSLSVGLSPLISASLSIAVLTYLSGAFHEDGLADMADGFGGGATPERRLIIMKDSRIGSFGAAALILAMIGRVAALAEVSTHFDTWSALAAIFIAGSISRSIGLAPLTFLPPARMEGASAAVGRPSQVAFGVAMALAVLLGIGFTLSSSLSLSGLLVGVVASGLCAAFLTFKSRRLIEGQTGDVAGAVQQLTEIAMLVALGLRLGGA